MLTDNIFRLLAIAGQEDPVTEVIANGLTHVPSFRRSFLTLVGLEDSPLEVQTRRRVTSGFPDLVAWRIDGGSTDLLIVENKLKAEEGHEQTLRYEKDSVVTELRRNHYPEPDRVVRVFLHLFPDQQPQSAAFRAISHRDLLEVVDRSELEASGSGWTGKALQDWLELLEDFYAAGEVNGSDILLQRLSDKPALEGGFLYYQNWLGRLGERIPEFEVGPAWRASNPGRRYWGCQLFKKAWPHSEKMIDALDPIEFDPHRHIYVHFEPQFYPLSGQFILPLHYEPNQYKTETWMQTKVDAELYAEYNRVRDEFSDRLSRFVPESWAMRGGSNQIATARIDLQERTTEEATASVVDALREAGVAVDQALGILVN